MTSVFRSPVFRPSVCVVLNETDVSTLAGAGFSRRAPSRTDAAGSASCLHRAALWHSSRIFMFFSSPFLFESYSCSVSCPYPTPQEDLFEFRA